MHEALIFLQGNGVSHGDIHVENFIIDTSTQDPPGFPNLVLVDFGHSKLGEDHSGFTEFCTTLYGLAKAIKCDGNPPVCGDDDDGNVDKCNHTYSWADFIEALKKGLRREKRKFQPAMDALWEESGDVAIYHRKEAPTSVLGLIKETVFDKVEEIVAEDQALVLESLSTN